MERESFPTLDEALIAVEARFRSLVGGALRDTRSFLGREYGPGAQVAARAELRGPGGLRAGMDLRGDGSCEAWTGRLARRPLEAPDGADAFAALRRAAG